MPEDSGLRGFNTYHLTTHSVRRRGSPSDNDDRLTQLDQQSVKDMISALWFKDTTLEHIFDRFAYTNFRNYILEHWTPGSSNLIHFSVEELNSAWAELRILQMFGLDKEYGSDCAETSLGHRLLEVYLLNYQHHYRSIADRARGEDTKPPQAARAIRFLTKIAKHHANDRYLDWLYFELQLLAKLCSQHQIKPHGQPDPYWDRYVRQRFLDFFASPAQAQRINWARWWETAELLVKCIFDRDDRHFATIINSLVEECELAIERNSLSSYDNRRPGNRLEPSMHELRINYQRLAWLKPAQQLLSEANRNFGLDRSLFLKPPAGERGYGRDDWHFMRDIEFAVSDWELMPDPDAIESQQSKLIECATVTATITLHSTLPEEPERQVNLLGTLSSVLSCQIDGSGSASATSPTWHSAVPHPEISDYKLDVLQMTWRIGHTDPRNPARWRFGGIAFEVQCFPNPIPVPSETKEAMPS